MTPTGVCCGTAWVEWLRTPLEHAAGAGNLDLVTKLQGAGAGGSALHLALRAGQDALARELLRLGAPTKAMAKNGDTPRHLAAASGLGDVLSLLLRDGAEVDVLDSRGRTSIHLSAESGSLSAVQALLAAGGDPSLRYGKDEALSALGLAASSGGYVEVMQALIRHGVDVNAHDSNGCTALHSAAMGDKVGAIDTLIEAGANINVQRGKYDDARSTPPLHMASEKGYERYSALRLATCSGHIATVKSLLAAGANVDLRPAALCKSAFDSACLGGHADVVTTLIQHGAKVDATDSCGRTALFDVSRENTVTVIDKVVAAGASVNVIVDHYGKTLLHHACLDDCPGLVVDAIDALVSAGAIIDAQENHMSTPLVIAFRGAVFRCKKEDNCGSEEFAAMIALLKHGADPNVRNVMHCAASDPTLPRSAVSTNYFGAERIYMETQDSLSQIALHKAAESGSVLCIDVLVSAGAVTGVKDMRRCTPFTSSLGTVIKRPRWPSYEPVQILLRWTTTVAQRCTWR
ncbi:unnamed protein product [Ectocarpus sp. CCAP 1310/34]|nr:unnamed protein product [Ectocarpus sp. CCAP 1310/34]